MKYLLTFTIFFKVFSLSIMAKDFITNQNADFVLGQTLFTTASTTPLSEKSLRQPIGVAVDPKNGKVFVADSANNRVLRYASSSSLASGAPADAVFGQANFFSNTAGLTQKTLNGPRGLCVDSSGTLYVADYYNNRILAYSDISPSTDALAAQLLGQPTYTTAAVGNGPIHLNHPRSVFITSADTLFVADGNNHRVLGFKKISLSGDSPPANLVIGQTAFNVSTSGINEIKMNVPSSVWVDAEDHLWVADSINSRVLRFDHAGTLPQSNASANGVLGQPNFTTKNTDLTANSMLNPGGVAVDTSGSLYVGDQNNNRVTIYKNAGAKGNGSAADLVLGQPNFTTNTISQAQNTTPSAANLAFDTSGRLFVVNQTANRVLRFTKQPTPVPVLVTPTVKITGKKKITTSLTQLRIKGTASAIGSSVQLVQVKLGKKVKSAKGTASWSYKAKKLKLGKNVFIVSALSSNGFSSAPAKLKVNRK